MGTHYFYANIDAREYFSPTRLGDNGKLPIDQSAYALLELLKTDWNGARIAVYSDSGDLPWDCCYGMVVAGNQHSDDCKLKTAPRWTDITPVVAKLLEDYAWGYTYPGGDYQTAQYVNLRVCDDRGYPVRGGQHAELLARCIKAIEKVEPVK